MMIDPGLLSPASALLGALIGGGGSLVAAIYKQRSVARLDRVASEITSRESVYADFMMHASNLLLRAYTTDDLVLTGDEQHLIGLIFAAPEIVATAEAVLKAIVEISLMPRVELRQLAKDALSKSPNPDPLVTFSLVCRADLESVRRTTV